MINRDLFPSLDAGCDIELDLSAEAEDYEFAWWKSEDEPSTNQILSYSNIREALEFHRQLTGIKGIVGKKMDKSRYTWNRNVSFLPESQEIQCNRCRLYRGITLGVLDNIQDLRHYVHALEVTYEERSDLSIRRAAGFFQLYEAALMKEVQADAGKGKEKAKERENSQTQDPSLKWTWGPVLTEDEVRKLPESRSLLFPPKVHSGYNASLPWGVVKEGSRTPSSPGESSCVYSDIDQDCQRVPEMINPDDIDLRLFMLRNSLDDPPRNWTPHQVLPPMPSVSRPLLPGQEYPWLELPQIYYMYLPREYPQHQGANKSIRLEATDGKEASDHEDFEKGDMAFPAVDADKADVEDEGDMAAAAADALWESDTSNSVLGDIAVCESEDSEQDMASAATDAFYDSDENEEMLVGGRIGRAALTPVVTRWGNDDIAVPIDDADDSDDNESDFPVPSGTSDEEAIPSTSANEALSALMENEDVSGLATTSITGPFDAGFFNRRVKAEWLNEVEDVDSS